MIVRFYNEIKDEKLKFAVIAARIGSKWVFVRHRKRSTYELPGGHRETGENIFETAKRELYEETGITGTLLHEVSVYSVEGKTRVNETGEETYGMLYFTEAAVVGELPQSEIQEVVLLEEEPDQWTYPGIQPHLLARVKEWLSEHTKESGFTRLG